MVILCHSLLLTFETAKDHKQNGRERGVNHSRDYFNRVIYIKVSPIRAKVQLTNLDKTLETSKMPNRFF